MKVEKALAFAIEIVSELLNHAQTITQGVIVYEKFLRGTFGAESVLEIAVHGVDQGDVVFFLVFDERTEHPLDILCKLRKIDVFENVEQFDVLDAVDVDAKTLGVDVLQSLTEGGVDFRDIVDGFDWIGVCDFDIDGRISFVDGVKHLMKDGTDVQRLIDVHHEQQLLVHVGILDLIAVEMELVDKHRPDVADQRWGDHRFVVLADIEQNESDREDDVPVVIP